ISDRITLVVVVMGPSFMNCLPRRLALVCSCGLVRTIPIEIIRVGRLEPQCLANGNTPDTTGPCPGASVFSAQEPAEQKAARTHADRSCEPAPQTHPTSRPAPGPDHRGRSGGGRHGPLRARTQ